MFWELLLFQLHPTTNILTLKISAKSFFFKKNHIFFYYYQILNVLRCLTFWVAFYCNVATFSNFLNKINFFSWNPPFFSIKQPIFWTFWEILLFQSHSTTIMIQLLFFLNKTVSFQGTTHFFAAKNLNFERLEKTY